MILPLINETTAKYIHATLKHTSMGMTNLIGPIEEMSLADHPIKGWYFVVAGTPQVPTTFFFLQFFGMRSFLHPTNINMNY